MSYYLMHRGWMDNPVFKREAFTEAQAWIWLIEQASYQPHKIRYASRMISVDRGDVPTSYRRLKTAWEWGNDRVRRFLDLLETEKMILKKTGTGFLVITVCNYEKYQSSLTNTGTEAGTLAGTEAGTAAGTNRKKGLNKGKERKRNNNYSEGFENFWKTYPKANGHKKPAWVAWQRSIELASVETIIAGAESYNRYCGEATIDIQYRQHAATWLNQAGWETQYITKSQQQKIASDERFARLEREMMQ